MKNFLAPPPSSKILLNENDFLARLGTILRNDLQLPDAEVEDELRRFRYYLQDIKQTYLRAGRSESEAWEATVREVGSPESIAAGYTPPIAGICFGGFIMTFLFVLIMQTVLALFLLKLISEELSVVLGGCIMGGFLGKNMLQRRYKDFWGHLLTDSRALVSVTETLLSVFTLAVVGMCLLVWLHIKTAIGLGYDSRPPGWNLLEYGVMSFWCIHGVGAVMESRVLGRLLSKLLIRRRVQGARYGL